jgi:HAD superfamily hydrolase (TIGR01509 family)
MSPLPPRFRGLLCDLDGTLADSEPLHCASWLGLLNERYGLDYDEQWFEQWIGTSDRTVASNVIDTNGLPVSSAQLIELKQRRFHREVRERGDVFPGVHQALGEIAAEFPLAIATNSGRADADLMIGSTGLDRHTRISVTASDVARMKPEPDIYLLAAERLGLSPRDCIAIEDSGPGGVAARAAGCYLIAVTGRVGEADERVDSRAGALVRALSLLREGRDGNT